MSRLRESLRNTVAFNKFCTSKGKYENPNHQINTHRDRVEDYLDYGTSNGTNCVRLTIFALGGTPDAEYFNHSWLDKTPLDQSMRDFGAQCGLVVSEPETILEKNGAFTTMHDFKLLYWNMKVDPDQKKQNYGVSGMLVTNNTTDNFGNKIEGHTFALLNPNRMPMKTRKMLKRTNSVAIIDNSFDGSKIFFLKTEDAWDHIQPTKEKYQSTISKVSLVQAPGYI